MIKELGNGINYSMRPNKNDFNVSDPVILDEIAKLTYVTDADLIEAGKIVEDEILKSEAVDHFDKSFYISKEFMNGDIDRTVTVLDTSTLNKFSDRSIKVDFTYNNTESANGFNFMQEQEESLNSLYGDTWEMWEDTN